MRDVAHPIIPDDILRRSKLMRRHVNTKANCMKILTTSIVKSQTNYNFQPNVINLIGMIHQCIGCNHTGRIDLIDKSQNAPAPYPTLFRVTGPLWGESIGHRWIPFTKASDAKRWCSLGSAHEQRLNKQSRRWWFETPSCPLWRHCNGIAM